MSKPYILCLLAVAAVLRLRVLLLLLARLPRERLLPSLAFCWLIACLSVQSVIG